MRRGARPRLAAPWGACVHTTGRGLARVARLRLDRPPTAAEVMATAIEEYATSRHYPGWVVGLEGERHQVCADESVTYHVGNELRDSYLDGSWMSSIGRETLAQWRRRWPAAKSPAHLYPARSANESYIGIELIPTTDVAGVEPAGPGETFTAAQYAALRGLLAELAERWDWPSGWTETSRLVGHEDVAPLDRHDSGGGWDPGALRAVPRFRWERVTG